MKKKSQSGTALQRSVENIERSLKWLQKSAAKVHQNNENQMNGFLFSSSESRLLLFLSELYIREQSFDRAEGLLSGLEKKTGVEMAYKNPWKYFQNQGILLMHEMLGQCRRGKEMTQDGEIYQTDLRVRDFHVIEMNKKLELLMSDQRWEEAETPRYNEACIQYNLHEPDLEDFKNICEELPGIDSEGWKDEQFWEKPLRGIESDLLNGLAMIYWKREELEKSAYMLFC